MKIKTKGFSVIEFVMIVVVLIIVGTFVYFASQSKKVDVTATNTTTTTSGEKVVTVIPANAQDVTNYVKQIATDAESRYNAGYKSVFTASNASRDNGAGIIPSNTSLVSKLVDEVATRGSSIFVITNDKVTSYAIYGKLPDSSGATKYYCLGSDGSKKASTEVVIDNKGLTNKPICK
jgi:hypothetical protein